MVVEIRKGRGRFFSNGINARDGIVISGLCFSVLIEENGKEIRGEIGDINEGLTELVGVMENRGSGGEQGDSSRFMDSRFK